MPLSINVGLSCKASKDFQSAGVSINVTAELDQSLLARPEELQRQIGDLYGHASHALEVQAGGPSEPSGQVVPASARSAAPRPANGNGRHVSPMTSSQRRAIQAIARRLEIDPAAEARATAGVEFDDLSLRQASELIDHLKGIQPAGSRAMR